jgi:hypothetical protein
MLFAPLYRSSPFKGGVSCQAIQTEHGLFIAERTPKAVYIVKCLWCTHHNTRPAMRMRGKARESPRLQTLILSNQNFFLFLYT